MRVYGRPWIWPFFTIDAKLTSPGGPSSLACTSTPFPSPDTMMGGLGETTTSPGMTVNGPPSSNLTAVLSGGGGGGGGCGTRVEITTNELCSDPIFRVTVLWIPT